MDNHHAEPNTSDKEEASQLKLDSKDTTKEKRDIFFIEEIDVEPAECLYTMRC